MASFIIFLTGASTGSARGSIRSTTTIINPRSGGGLLREEQPSSIRVGTSSSDKAKLTVKATGGAAKYKGTQMREKQLSEMIENKVKEAREVCGSDETSDECKVAWDEVEEVSQAKADLRLKLLEQRDPLKSYCAKNPETDECRIYED